MDNKTPWSDISRVWKKIAAVIVAVGTIATVLTKVFNTPDIETYTICTSIGVIVLMISWYSDRQAEYVLKELELHKVDSDKKIEGFHDALKEITKIVGETRIDTIRIQLIMIINSDPKNVDTILKLAQKYFVELEGDWYMTTLFMKWAKDNDVIVPEAIFNQTKHHID